MSDILIVAEHRNEELFTATLEIVTVAQNLKEGAGGSVAVVVIAEDPDAFVPGVSVSGVDEVIKVKSEVAEFQPEIYEATLQELVKERNPGLVLVPFSVNSFDYAPSLAAKGEHGFASDVISVGYQGSDLVATREVYGGGVNMDVDFPYKDTVVLSVRRNTFAPSGGEASPTVSNFEAPSVKPRSEHKEFTEPPKGDIDLSQEEYVLAVGGGIQNEADLDKFFELAGQLDMALGGSRPLADAGWLPKYRQVGQSGNTLGNCKLYIAMGISGATQHLAGIQGVDNIVAINTNQRAPIFETAGYGILADMHEIADAVKDKLQ
jgi:electron transfer flavoprotein alpha subunit